MAQLRPVRGASPATWGEEAQGTGTGDGVVALQLPGLITPLLPWQVRTQKWREAGILHFGQPDWGETETFGAVPPHLQKENL